MKNLTWQYPEQLFVAQVLINQVKSKCCGIKEQNEPLKNCSWICYDVDEDLYEGRTLGSLKDTPKEMLQLDIQDSIMLYNRYVYMGARRLEGKEVQVETFVLE